MFLENHILVQAFLLIESIVSFHIETSYLICCANQVTGFYMEFNNGLK